MSNGWHEHEWTDAPDDEEAWYCPGCGLIEYPSEPLDVEKLGEAWGNVMDGRRIGEGLNAARVSRQTTTPDDWRAIAAEYARLAGGWRD